MRQNREKCLLYIGVCAALIPVLLMRDFTPSNELRYLSIADEALRNHTFFSFTHYGEPYADKPPLYLWLVMLCKWLTGAHHMWLLALFTASWGLPEVNPGIGYGDLARQGLDISRKTGVRTYCSWGVRNGADIDVYLHSPVADYAIADCPPAEVPRPAVLFIHERDLTHFPDAHECAVVGRYAVAWLKGK